MIDQITQELLRQGFLGVLLVASWVIIGILWNVWRKESKEWETERTTLYKEARQREQEQFTLMAQTFQGFQGVLIEMKTMLQQKS
jgi:hypothetical protein